MGAVTSVHVEPDGEADITSSRRGAASPASLASARRVALPFRNAPETFEVDAGQTNSGK